MRFHSKVQPHVPMLWDQEKSIPLDEREKILKIHPVHSVILSKKEFLLFFKLAPFVSDSRFHDIYVKDTNERFLLNRERETE